jgi:hypothetical protein
MTNVISRAECAALDDNDVKKDRRCGAASRA